MSIIKRMIIASVATITLSATYAQTKGDDFSENLKSGIELLDAGQYLPAKKKFLEARKDIDIDNKSQSEKIDFYIAICSAESGDSESNQMLEAFSKKYPNTIYSDKIHLALGNMYQKQNDYEKSLSEYTLVDPYALSATARSEFFFNKGYAAFSVKKYDEAIRNFDMVGADKVFEPSATYYKAYIAYINENYDEAKRGFESLVNDKIYSPVIPFYLVQIDFKTRNYAAVVESAPQLADKAVGERQAELYRIIGESYYHLGNYDQALRYLEMYAQKNPSMSREEKYMTGYAAYMVGKLPRAVELLSEVAVGEDLLAQNAAYHIGSISIREGNKQRAIQAFSLAMHINEDQTVREEAMFNFGKLQYELGNGVFNETVNTLNQYLKEFGDSPRVDEARGYLLAAYFNSQNYVAAYDAISKIKNPDNEVKAAMQKIAYFLALEHFNNGDYASALNMFEISANNRFNAKYTALTKFWNAETLFRQGLYSRAIPLYQDFIVLSPKGDRENIIANYNLAYCYFNTKNIREATIWFDRFLNGYKTEDNIKADAYNRVGDINFVSRDYRKAIGFYDRAMKAGGTAADYAQFQRAISIGLTDGPQQKITALQAILKDSKSEYADDAMYELGSTYTKLERFDEASATLKKFIEHYPTSIHYISALSDLGLINQNIGKNSEALRYYKMVVEQHPNSPQSKDAILGIRNIYVDNNDLEGYFAFARNNGIETNISVVERDSLTFSVAERIYISGDCRRAEPLLKTYLSQYPNGGYVANATYYVADCKMRSSDVDGALEGFENVIAMPFNPFTATALTKASKINFERENFAKAADQYNRLSKLSTNRAVLEEALIGYVKSSANIGGNAALEAAEYAMASPFATDEIRNESKFIIAKDDLSKGNREKAMSGFRDAASNLKSASGAESQYMIIDMLFENGDLDKSETEILKFSEANTPHQYWLGKAFLTLGNIYFKRGDEFQAKATFRSIIDGYSNPDDGIIEEAKTKISTLK